MGEVLTANAVERLLERHHDARGGDWYDLMKVGKVVNVDGLGDVETVEVTNHDEYNMQLQIVLTAGGRTFVKQGVWVSHDGAYWDGDFFEAHQVEKVVTVWDPVS